MAVVAISMGIDRDQNEPLAFLETVCFRTDSLGSLRLSTP